MTYLTFGLSYSYLKIKKKETEKIINDYIVGKECVLNTTGNRSQN